jgi:hypothetical protein
MAIAEWQRWRLELALTVRILHPSAGHADGTLVVEMLDVRIFWHRAEEWQAA